MRFPRLRPALILLVACQTAAAVGVARASGDVRAFITTQSPLEKRLFRETDRGRLGDFSPLGAALVASGAGSAGELDRYERKAAALVQALRGAGVPALPPARRAEAVFDFLHREVLRFYSLADTDVRRVLDEGRFNCISGSVLFNCLGGAVGLNCRGLEMPGHAMSRVVLPGRNLDVEVTCPRWFHVSDGGATGEAAQAYAARSNAPAADPSKAREVTPLQMAAMIYYNRGVELLAAKRFAEAADADAKAVRLDPTNASAFGNLLATINNWAIELENRGQYADAARLLRGGLAMRADFGAFSSNYVHVCRQWTDKFCREGRFEEAMAVIRHAEADLPGDHPLRELEREIRSRGQGSVSAASLTGRSF